MDKLCSWNELTFEDTFAPGARSGDTGRGRGLAVVRPAWVQGSTPNIPPSQTPSPPMQPATVAPGTEKVSLPCQAAQVEQEPSSDPWQPHPALVLQQQQQEQQQQEQQPQRLQQSPQLHPPPQQKKYYYWCADFVRAGGVKLGFSVKPDDAGLQVHAIGDTGAVPEWNQRCQKSFPKDEIRTNDVITSVNGVGLTESQEPARKWDCMFSRLHSAEHFLLEMRRSVPANDL